MIVTCRFCKKQFPVLDDENDSIVVCPHCSSQEFVRGKKSYREKQREAFLLARREFSKGKERYKEKLKEEVDQEKKGVAFLIGIFLIGGGQIYVGKIGEGISFLLTGIVLGTVASISLPLFGIAGIFFTAAAIFNFVFSLMHLNSLFSRGESYKEIWLTLIAIFLFAGICVAAFTFSKSKRRFCQFNLQDVQTQVLEHPYLSKI